MACTWPSSHVRPCSQAGGFRQVRCGCGSMSTGMSSYTDQCMHAKAFPHATLPHTTSYDAISPIAMLTVHGKEREEKTLPFCSPPFRLPTGHGGLLEARTTETAMSAGTRPKPRHGCSTAFCHSTRLTGQACGHWSRASEPCSWQ